MTRVPCKRTDLVVWEFYPRVDTNFVVIMEPDGAQVWDAYEYSTTTAKMKPLDWDEAASMVAERTE